MKTLKQIREEYNNSYISQVEHLPEELMLEKNVIPSLKEMPQLLVFRRVSFRTYPKGQVVALYYSKLMDKYLSVPIGPGNSVNLSESVVADTLDEACWKGYEMVGMKKKGSKKVPNCVPVKETGPVMSRYTDRPLYETFKERVEKLREERMEEGVVGDTIEKGRKWIHDKVKDSKTFKAAQEIGHHLPGYEDVKNAKQHFAKGEYKDAAKSTLHSLGKAAATGAGVAAAVGAGILGARTLGRSGLANLAKKALSGDDNKDSKGDREVVVSAPRQKSSPTAKHSSSWEKAPTENPIYKEKARQAMIAKENKIIDIRTMIKEGIDNMDLSINGRQVTLNTSMAKRILEVYDSVNTKNKKIVEGMLNEDLESFKKLLNFSIRN